MTLADSFDLGGEIMRTLPDKVAMAGEIWITFVLILLVAMLILFVAMWYSKKAEYQKAARLYTFSSAFWARWPGERLWAAPYQELAAEAARCEEILGSMGLTPPHYERKESDPEVRDDGAPEVNRRTDREGAQFRAKRDAVLRAMSNAIAQGRGPQQYQPQQYQQPYGA
ncbi:hypothetical protein [Mycolicibacterium sp. HK-90]|uniref:hypothetical protein n=1 Tax=Mycolicibacterium sp. HK-90 TaxID=3056937 RepID=UPI0026587A93|nr:hypothetical protein [Mycolicibacterium sp. HK-90]WKG04252.1 hypothetical protein QU592_03795 [Mycolicibacterium sp. HK-90]